MAASALVLVLAGIITSIPPTSAANPPKKPAPTVTTACRDTDGGKLPEKAGSGMIVQINTVQKAIKRLSKKDDACINSRTVREYFCKNDKTLSSQIINCTKGTMCLKGACVLPTRVPSTTLQIAPTTTPNLQPASTTPVAGPSAYCVLAGISYGDFTRVQSPNVGRGYAQVLKPGITTFAQLVASCSATDIAAMEAQYCAIPNQPSYSPNAVLYDAQGNFTIFGGCHDIAGCNYRTCAVTPTTPPPTTTPPVTNTITCTDNDGGENYDVRGTTDLAGRQYADTCSSDSQLIEHKCETYGNSYYVTSSTVSCSSGICSNGACITLTSE